MTMWIKLCERYSPCAVPKRENYKASNQPNTVMEWKEADPRSGESRRSLAAPRESVAAVMGADQQLTFDVHMRHPVHYFDTARAEATLQSNPRAIESTVPD